MSRNYIKSYIRAINRPKKLNILVVGSTHERYEQSLCKTNHNFYCLNTGKEWDSDFARIPENYFILEYVPHGVVFDAILIHTSCERLEIAFELRNLLNVPIIRHTHILPDVRYNVLDQVQNFKSIKVDVNTFISDFSRKQWGYNEKNSFVVEHGLDTDFWCGESYAEKKDSVLSAVNLWSQRDWACGWEIWKKTVGFKSQNSLPYVVVGKNDGLSKAASSLEDLRKYYSNSLVFLNTSLHSPIPMALLEAMACGCAVVSTNTCMIPEVIKHEENGLLGSDEAELRHHCQRLLKDKEFAIALGDSARKTILEKFNINRFVSDWNKIFESSLMA